MQHWTLTKDAENFGVGAITRSASAAGKTPEHASGGANTFQNEKNAGCATAGSSRSWLRSL